MAELSIDPALIRKALDGFVDSYKPTDMPTQEVGYVVTAGAAKFVDDDCHVDTLLLQLLQ